MISKGTAHTTSSSSALACIVVVVAMGSSAAHGSSDADAGALAQGQFGLPRLAQADSLPTSEASLRTSISNEVAEAWKRSDYSFLNSTAQRYLVTRAKTYSGKWRLSVFYSALSERLEIEWPDQWYLADRGVCGCKVPDPANYQEADRRWDALRAKVDQWARRAPQSPRPKLALAQMLVNRA
jgi:hypothetical protein